MQTRAPASHASRLLAGSAVASALLCLALVAAHLSYGSEVALGQGVDSLLDVVTGVGLFLTLRISQRPPDEGHHFGHRPAQPIAGLAVAVLTGVLALGVLRGAITTLLEGSSLRFGWPLMGAIGAKVTLKLVFLILVGPHAKSSTVLRAFQIDARNDLLLGVSSLVGLAAAAGLGLPSLDAWLALPVGIWIGISGFMLAKESTDILMGAAPPVERQQELARLAAGVEGVVRVEALKARQRGDGFHLWVEIRVERHTTVGDAHDLGEHVKRRLLREDDVVDVTTHIDAA